MMPRFSAMIEFFWGVVCVSVFPPIFEFESEHMMLEFEENITTKLR
jgi:hypothetical protein